MREWGQQKEGDGVSDGDSESENGDRKSEGDSESEECAMQVPQLSEHERMMRGMPEKFIYCDRQATAGEGKATTEREREREKGERGREKGERESGEQPSCLSPWKHLTSL